MSYFEDKEKEKKKKHKKLLKIMIVILTIWWASVIFYALFYNSNTTHITEVPEECPRNGNYIIDADGEELKKLYREFKEKCGAWDDFEKQKEYELKTFGEEIQVETLTIRIKE